MANLEFCGRIDAVRNDVAAVLDDRTKKLPPKERAALKEILDLLGEVADTAEEAGL